MKNLLTEEQAVWIEERLFDEYEKSPLDRDGIQKRWMIIDIMERLQFYSLADDLTKRMNSYLNDPFDNEFDYGRNV